MTTTQRVDILQVVLNENAGLRTENDEINAICELQATDIRVTREVAIGILESSQEAHESHCRLLATVRELLEHLSHLPADERTAALVRNVERSLGC